MNMQELQDRANIIVQRVNEYEASLEAEQGNETELLSEHKYCDIHCLRAVYDWITGCDETRKTNTTLNSTVNGKLYSFNTYQRLNSSFTEFQFTDLFYNTNNLTSSGSYNIENSKQQYSRTACRSNNGSDDICGLYNLKYLSGVFNFRVTSPPNTAITANDDYSVGWNNVTCVNIADALVTESQVVNLMDTNIIQFHSESNWQGSDNLLRNNLSCSNNYFGIYLFSNETNTSTGSPIGLNPNSTPKNKANNITTTIFGSTGASIGNNFQLKLFLPDASAIWANSATTIGQKYCYYYGNEAVSSGFVSNNKPAQQTYFELAFKRRRAGCKAAGLDFIPTLNTIMDNDPQGLATRFALAQCKPYYRGRPWFEELNELYTENGEYQAKLADAIEQETTSMDDTQYLQNYKLNYETVANVMEWPL